MLARISSLTIQQRQLLTIMSVTLFVLLACSSLFILQNASWMQRSASAGLNEKASLIAANSAQPLLINDRVWAYELLQALQLDPNIRYAVLYNPQNVVVAEFRREQSLLSIRHQGASSWLEITRDVEMDGERLGYLTIRADAPKLLLEMENFGVVVCMIVILCLSIAYLIAMKTQSNVGQPLHQMALWVRQVARDADYTQRFPQHRDDELGELVDGLNLLLEAIDDRQQQLRAEGQQWQQLASVRTEQLYRQANYDRLSGLPNRLLLQDRLERSLAKSRRDHSQFAVLMVDLDRFKMVNDNLGYQVGDAVIQRVSSDLAALVRDNDTVVRWGSDEFVILLERLRHPEDAARVAEKIRRLMELPIEVEGESLHISASIGISVFPKDGRTSQALLQHAELSLDRAKHDAASSYCFYKASMNEASMRRLQLENRLRHAFAEDQLDLHFQPQMSGDGRTVVGVEALLRWHDEQLGNVSPAQFVPVAEEIGLLPGIGLWVLQRAAQQHQHWRNQGLTPVRIAVNMSPSHLMAPKLVEQVVGVLQRNGMDPHYLEIEITEQTLLQSSRRIVANLSRLKRLGIHVAIDDFGTGYSSLSYLRQFPVDTLKIDGSFVQSIGSDSRGEDIVAATIALGHRLGLTMVAECVESEQQSEFLQLQGCDVSQGYLHSKPLTSQQLVVFLQNHDLLAANEDSAEVALPK